jgi:hypothetical protein
MLRDVRLKKPIDEALRDTFSKNSTDVDLSYHSVTEEQFADWPLHKKVNYCYDNFDKVFLKVKEKSYRVNLYPRNNTSDTPQSKIINGRKMKIIRLVYSESSKAPMAEVEVSNSVYKPSERGFVSLLSSNLEFYYYERYNHITHRNEYVYWNYDKQMWELGGATTTTTSYTDKFDF